MHHIFSDPTQLDGYQSIPDNLPEWKKAMIKKKNDQLVQKHMVCNSLFILIVYYHNYW